eukprot:Gregarina_sp_Poly_1__10519@NODE_773_length_6343_cov_143_248247_g568_i0_p6_GENE_NODE_773_length_6343_cov_143_248247_g568_i0NODE_773_length_6343_cov_143_248247_g568_i0_p6_ORF_typecomplete_len142_score14_01PSCyt2/PF07583_11/0_0024_NODE_773_length_6343_cov_143_248247_g568_i045470
MSLKQPPSHQQRGLPAPARQLKRDEEKRLRELDRLIEEKRQADHRTCESEHYLPYSKTRGATRLARDYVENELAHDGPRHEFMERQGIKAAVHQKSPVAKDHHQHRRHRAANSKQRRLSEQTGIVNLTDVPQFSRLVGDKT